ncbi:hypothetical protein oki361_23080 [Helicobacter pylori]
MEQQNKDNLPLFHIVISTPLGIYLDEQVYLATFKTSEGYRGLMKNATEFMASIIPSELYIEFSKDKKETYYVGNGIVYFKDNLLSMIINDISKEPLKVVNVENEEEQQKNVIVELKIKRNLNK